MHVTFNARFHHLVVRFHHLVHVTFKTGAALMDAGLSIAGLIGAQVCKYFHRKTSSSHVCVVAVMVPVGLR